MQPDKKNGQAEARPFDVKGESTTFQQQHDANKQEQRAR